MSLRKKDTTLASTFTKTTHSKPPPSLLPENNPLPSPLTILIIGASKGIGESIAYAYAHAGASTILLASRPSSLPSLPPICQKISHINPSTRTQCFTVDITNSASTAHLAADVRTATTTLDIVVFNTGYSGPVVLHMDAGNPLDFKDVLDVNVLGTYHAAHHFLPLLKAAAPRGRGMFIAVGSFAALITEGEIANTGYCVAKFAQARIVEFLAEQAGREGVVAVGVHPGAVRTEMAERTAPESFMQYLTDDVGLCGAFCVWLSKEKREWLNGRLVSAKWDVDELLEKKDDIVKLDLLKLGYRIGGHLVTGSN
ncbi:hypothetical protein GQ44DRAFT_721403 [Phaeosphaeriaceae sp. PMI808]|nr:hypothetical protein GQ44DRAFT_721403 [Phaeosphaeriaceae sp. PMI808]